MPSALPADNLQIQIAPEITGADWQHEVPLRQPDPLLNDPPEAMPAGQLTGLGVTLRRAAAYARSIPPNVSFGLDVRRRLKQLPPAFHPHEIPPDFFGINVAPGPTPAHNEFILNRLDDLGVRRVRVNYGYAEQSRALAGPFIEALSRAKQQVLLNVVPPKSDAFRMGRPAVDARWRDFLEDTFARHRGHIAACEIGSTVNRFKWAGFTAETYARASAIAADVCRRFGVPRYGPNVTDFEPTENIGYLNALRRSNCLPDVHTTNLFVDRANQPENPDPNVAGYRLAETLGLDTVGKARLLAAISLAYNLPPRLLCTYTYWTLNYTGAPRRRYVTLEQYARYLARFCALTAACGYLKGVYWGTMISYTKGLIDDGTGYKPFLPAVHHLWWTRGDVADYATRPGFQAFQTVIARIAGTSFQGRLPSREGTYLLLFQRSQHSAEERLLIAWTRDGLQDELPPYLRGRAADIVRIEDLYGRRLPHRPGALPAISESPLYITLRGGPPDEPSLVHVRSGLSGFRVPEGQAVGMCSLETGRWRGAMRAELAAAGFAETLIDPETLFKRPGAVAVNESRRGRLADVPLPEFGTNEHDPRAMVKRFPPRRLRRDGRSRATRAWDSACELLSRNVPTAMPLAVLETRRRPWRNPSYFLTEKIVGAVTLREMLNACRLNQPLPLDVSREAFIRELGRHIYSMHSCGVWHRDLTGGNILVRLRAGPDRAKGRLEFTLIDVSRARFRLKLGMLPRLLDLARVRVPPEDRRAFVLAYTGGDPSADGPVPRWWWRYRLVHRLYRIKVGLKALIPPW